MCYIRPRETVATATVNGASTVLSTDHATLTSVQFVHSSIVSPKQSWRRSGPMNPESSSDPQSPSSEQPPPSNTSENDESASDPAASVSPSLSLDLIFELLKNQRRRRAIAYLTETDETVSLSELAEHIAALEHDTTPAALSSTERKRVYVGLYQAHLPKLDDAGVVDFNKPRGRIRLGPTAPQLLPYLKNDPTPHASIRWAWYYLGLTGASGAAFLVILFTVGRDLWLSGMISGFLIGVAALSLLQYYCP